MHSSIPKELAAGLATLDNLRAEGRAAGVYGPIIELFECDDKFTTAVEVAAGISLFHVVVDSDATAGALIAGLTDEHGGRVTFVPLNRLDSKDIPVARSEQVKPLVEVLQFKSTFEKAFVQVFGKYLLCGSTEVAANVARLNRASCITLDGDRVSSRGAISGGYYDPKRSKIASYREIKHARAQIDAAKQKKQELRARLSGLDERIDALVAEVAVADSDRIKAREEFDYFDRSCSSAAKELLSFEESLVVSTRSLTEVELSVRSLEEAKQSLEAEMTGALAGLSDDERAELHELSVRLPALRQRVFEVSGNRVTLESEKVELENALSSHLLQRRDELERALASGQLPEIDDAGHLRAERTRAKDDLDRAKSALEALDAQKQELESAVVAMQQSLDDLASSESSLSGEVDEQARVMDRLLNKKLALTEKRDEAGRRLREVGTLPAEVLSAFASKSLPECMRLLTEASEGLKQFTHVNKKALDQYTTFSNQREALVNRKEELDESEAAIANLVETLDHHKDEAIERTVKGVSKFFSDIFAELTSGGRASLVKLIRYVCSFFHL